MANGAQTLKHKMIETTNRNIRSSLSTPWLKKQWNDYNRLKWRNFIGVSEGTLISANSRSFGSVWIREDQCSLPDLERLKYGVNTVFKAAVLKSIGAVILLDLSHGRRFVVGVQDVFQCQV